MASVLVTLRSYDKPYPASFQAMTGPGTEIYFEDGLIATRSVLESMDSILKNYEVLCAHKVTCHKDFDNTTSN